MNKKEIFLIPYSHLDTQWRWEYPTTINKYIKNTMNENINLFNKYEEHQFNFTGAIRYEFMKQYYPEKFEEVKKLVSENRWHLAGTCLDETDALVPNMESMVRNILYGDRWQLKEFGKSSRDYMIPDCFGFPKNMPTVMKHAGIEGFSSNKLTWGSAVGIPFELGKWKGSDGSEVISAFNPCRYDSHMGLPIKFNPGRQKRLNTLGKKNDVWKSFQYYGVGDIGGSPTEGSVKRAIKSMKYFNENHKKFTVKQGSADQFFKSISKEEASKLDSYNGDLLLTQHSAGTLTSGAIMKRWNRKNEQLAYAAETAAVMASNIAGARYPQDKINEAWKRVIASQMHDILPGTSTPLAYEYSQNDEVIALNIWTSILEDSAKVMSPFIKGEGNIIVFNPLGEERFDLVSFKFPKAQECSHLQDDMGNKYQVYQREDTVYFTPKLKPMSYTRFSILNEDVKKGTILTDLGEFYELNNGRIKVSISKNGSITSILDCIQNKELLKAPIAYEFQKERPFKFPAWNMDWKDRKKEPYLRIEQGTSVEIIDNDASMATILITTIHNKSTFKKYVTLTKDANMVAFKEHINWYEKGSSLKLSIMPNMSNPVTTYNWESERVERGINHKKRYEVPSRLWMNVSENDFGFSILEDSKYGYDRPTKDNIRMTLLFTPAIYYFNFFWDQRYHDFGEHTIRYAIAPNKGSFDKTDKLAREFNLPSRSYYVDDFLEEKPTKTDSFITLNTSDIAISAIKKAEDSNNVIVRMYNRTGKDIDSQLTSIKNIVKSYTVNGLEEVQKELKVSNNHINFSIPKYGLIAVMIAFDSVESSSIVQEHIKLNCNSKLFSNNSKKDAIYPLELLPNIVHSGEIKYHLNKRDSNNAITAEGQSISIPKGYNTVHLLVSSKQAKEVLFTIEGLKETKHNIFVPSATNFIGQWDKRIWKNKIKHHLRGGIDYVWTNPYVGIEEGYINRDRLDLFTTHTHGDSKNLAYQFGYMYSVSIDIKETDNTLVLPNEKDIYIFAITCANESTRIEDLKVFEDKYDF